MIGDKLVKIWKMHFEKKKKDKKEERDKKISIMVIDNRLINLRIKNIITKTKKIEQRKNKWIRNDII